MKLIPGVLKGTITLFTFFSLSLGAHAACAEESEGDKLYTVIDGKDIDENTKAGWSTFRGAGTCGACHGGAAQGGAGPSLVKSIQDGMTKEQFTDIVNKGKDGTLMKSFNGNTAVVENMDNMYAYIQARADDVLGEKALTKYVLGKKELGKIEK